jgi:hypothetical protein
MFRALSVQTVVAHIRGLCTGLVAAAAAGVLATAAVPPAATVTGVSALTTVAADATPLDHGWD